MKEIYVKLLEMFEKNCFTVLATIIQQAGPSPRGIGTKCLIMEDGSIAGTIGGGALEAETLAEASRVFESGLPRQLHFSLTGQDVEDTDMLCGGEMAVFLEPVSPQRMSHLAIFQRVMKLLNWGGKGLLATVLDEDRWWQGHIPKLFLDHSGEKVGSLLGVEEIDDALLAKADQFFSSPRPLIVPLIDDAGNSVDIFVEPIVSSPVLYVFGGGHVSKQIVPLAAHVGFNVVVTDDREEFADAGRFPDAMEVHHTPFQGILDTFSIDNASFIVIVTRGHMHDKEVLSQALKTDAKYIGMIGSKRKRNIIYQKLMEEGVSEQDLCRVHSPIGLEIGADTPEEIAVSIVAELIKERANFS